MPVPSTARKAKEVTPGLAMVAMGVEAPVEAVENSRTEAEVVPVAAVS